MDPIKETIETIIRSKVAPLKEFVRDPIIGYASARDPLYDRVDAVIGHKQLHPRDLLPDAETVVVFFIPHSENVIAQIRRGKNIVQVWSDNYTKVNDLLADIGETLKQELKRCYHIDSALEPPTNNYDDIRLTAKWAHKTSGVIAGIGTFGVNRLLITKSGCAGRLNSIIINKALEPTARPDSPYCLYYKTGKCLACAVKCPSGAITRGGWNRFRCNAYLDGKNIRDSEQGCGMCSSGPCADRGF